MVNPLEFFEYLAIGEVKDFGEGTPKLIRVLDRAVSIFNVQGELFAMDDLCPHRGGPLSEGTVKEGQVTCPWHGLTYDLRTGRCTHPDGKPNVRTYQLSIQGTEVFLAIPI